MNAVLRNLLLASAAVILGGRQAAATTVACGSGQKLQAAINLLKPSTGYQSINVTGACKENLSIPPNLSVALVGTTGASLSPATSGPATISVQGRLYVYDLTIHSSDFAGIYLAGAGLVAVGMTIAGPGTGIQVSNGSVITIQNVVVSSTANAAVSTYNNGTVEVDGVPPVGTFKQSSLTGSTGGLQCYGGGNVELNASGGTISLSNSGDDGLDAQGCTVNTSVSNGHIIVISHNKGHGVAAFAAASVNLSSVQLEDNGKDGIYAGSNAAVLLNGASVVSGNTEGALQASQNAIVQVQNFAGGVNTISAPFGNTDALFNCYQSGKVFVQQIAGYITPAPTAANMGCLTVGGP